MRGNQLVRQWKIIKLIERRKHGISVADIGNELEVPLRTVYRDLEALHESGFPLYTERDGKNSLWKLIDSFKKDFPVPLTVTELMSLHMSRDLLRVFEGTIFHESIESLFSKVKAALNPETVRFIENISGRLKISFSPTRNLSGFKDIIKSVSEATASRKRVELLYKAVSTGRQTRRKVDPYQVWAMNGGFYLIGLCHVRNAIRTFAMDRIKSLTVLDESFQQPNDFKLEDYLQTAFHVMRGEPQRIKVRISPGAAHVARERIWHPSQELRELTDGGIEISLDIPINYEIISWILGFGAAAEVMEPPSLRKRILGDLQKAASRYSKLTSQEKLFRKNISAHLS